MTITEFRAQIKAAGREIRKKRNFEVMEVLWCGCPIASATYAEIHGMEDASSILRQVEQRKDEIGKANTRQFGEMLAPYFRHAEAK